MLLCLTSPEKYVLNFFEMALVWKVLFVGALALPISSAICIYFWSFNNWGNHPMWNQLENAVPDEWIGDSIASAINTEIRRPNLFSTGHYSQKVLPIASGHSHPLLAFPPVVDIHCIFCRFMLLKTGL